MLFRPSFPVQKKKSVFGVSDRDLTGGGSPLHGELQGFFLTRKRGGIPPHGQNKERLFF